MAGAGSLPDYSYLLEEEGFLDWFWDGQNATKVILSLNNHNFKKSGKGADFLRREKHSPTIYGVVVRYGEDQSIRVPSSISDLTSFDQLFNMQKDYLCLMKVGFTGVSSDPKDVNRLETVREANEYNGQASHILFSLPIYFVDVTNPREVEKKIRYELGIKLDKEIAKQLGLTEPTEWVITSTKLTFYVATDILGVEKDKTGNDLRVLTTKVFGEHQRKLKELKMEVASTLKPYEPFLSSSYPNLWSEIYNIVS